jgi:hypothetical protein
MGKAGEAMVRHARAHHVWRGKQLGKLIGWCLYCAAGYASKRGRVEFFWEGGKPKR